MFDNIQTRRYKEKIIEYGIKNGKPLCTDILFIKVGQDGSCYGYRNKYVRMAERISCKYGITVIVSSNPFDGENPLDDAMEVIREYCCEKDLDFEKARVFYMGVSNGAVVGAWYAHLYDNIEKMLLVNMPVKISYWHITQEGIQNFIVKDKNIDIVYGEYDTCGMYIELFDDMKSDRISTHIVMGEDHNFTFSMEKFLLLPERYLLAGRDMI